MASRRVISTFSWLLAGSLGGAVGCFPPDEGRPVPLDKIYFPVGIQVSPGKKWMYVANSDFDLQYNAGTLQVYDLAALRAKVPAYCDERTPCSDSEKQECDTTGKGTGPKGADGAPTHRCVDKARRDPCALAGTDVQDVSDQSLTPGLCKAIEPAPLLFGGTKKGVVSIGAFATDLLYATNPLKNGKGGQILIPVRGDATVHWVTVDDDTQYPDQTDHQTHVALDCGQSGPTNACDGNHRRGNAKDQTKIGDPEYSLPSEPFGIALQARRYGGVPDALGSQFVPPTPVPGTDGGSVEQTAFSETLVTTHQTTGEAALFIDHWSTSPSADDGPELVFVGGGLPSGALAVAAVPLPAFWQENMSRVAYLPSYLMTFTNAPQVTLLRTFRDTLASPARPFIDASRSSPITTNSSGFESRGIAIDASARSACESPTKGKCVEGNLPAGMATRADCLLALCETTPVEVFAANRSPATLLIGRTPPPAPNTLPDDLPQFYDSQPMTAGPSRVFVGNILDKSGNLARRVFIICFDSRRVFIYDPATRRFEAEINTGRGPHAFALDVVDKKTDPNDVHAYAYLGHFSDSYIGVIDLDQSHTSTYGTIVLSVGERTPPRASK